MRPENKQKSLLRLENLSHLRFWKEVCLFSSGFSPPMITPYGLKIFGTETNRKFMLKMKIPLVSTGCFSGAGLICVVSCETVQRVLLDISS